MALFCASKAYSVCVYYNILSHCFMIVSVPVWLAICFLMTVNIFLLCIIVLHVGISFRCKREETNSDHLKHKRKFIASNIKEVHVPVRSGFRETNDFYQQSLFASHADGMPNFLS